MTGDDNIEDLAVIALDDEALTDEVGTEDIESDDVQLESDAADNTDPSSTPLDENKK